MDKTNFMGYVQKKVEFNNKRMHAGIHLIISFNTVNE